MSPAATRGIPTVFPFSTTRTIRNAVVARPRCHWLPAKFRGQSSNEAPASERLYGEQDEHGELSPQAQALDPRDTPLKEQGGRAKQQQEPEEDDHGTAGTE